MSIIIEVVSLSSKTDRPLETPCKVVCTQFPRANSVAKEIFTRFMLYF